MCQIRYTVGLVHKESNLRKLMLIIVLAALATVSACSSLYQKSDEVYLRNSGSTLQPWKPANEAAALHWPYAWASVSAYLHEADGKEVDATQTCPEPHAFLLSNKWELWEELPRVGRKSQAANDLERKLQETHLRAEVWSNEASGTVIVAFGGTSALQDIAANARWFLPFLGADAYDVLTEHYVPAFIAAYQARANKPNGAWLKNARVVSTGHSLGGGLAQRFAYSLKPTTEVPRVKEVYGFNPSPVSGKRGVDGYADRANGLTIYRIYARGEILAGVRSILQWGNPGNERNEGQTWIDIRYATDWSWRTLLPDGWIKAHGMQRLACFMKNNLPV
jgi:hypothetical protein